MLISRFVRHRDTFQLDDVKQFLLLLGIAGVWAYVHTAFEWIFFVTKPSFFSFLRWPQKLMVLFQTPLLFVFGVLFFLISLFLLGLILGAGRSHFSLLLVKLGLSAALATTPFILIDNFTYTVFKVGTITFQNSSRLVYGLLFIGLGTLIFRWINKDFFFWKYKMVLKHLQKVGVGLFLLSVLTLFYTGMEGENSASPSLSSLKRMPHIFLISADGLNADRMSVYNPEEKTTPFLAKRSKGVFVFENCFANLNRTSGSLASVLTGKYGTTTHKLHSTHIFTGRDSYEHMPGILRQAGYESIQLGWRHHADARHWNMRNAFDEINAQPVWQPFFGFTDNTVAGRYQITIYFFAQTWDRLWERLKHAFGSDKMVITHDKNEFKDSLSNKLRVDHLIQMVRSSSKPIFAQVHLSRITSDESIQRFDSYVEKFVLFLESNDQLKNSVVVIYSDHGENYKATKRVPLMWWLPGAQFNVSKETTVQNLDIAPTLLDYLGIETPSWMEGHSLLRPVDPYRPIIVETSFWNSRGLPLVAQPSTGRGGPQGVGAVVCNTLFYLKLPSGKFRKGIPKGHTGRCDASQIPSSQKMRSYLIQHLKDRGYEVTSLKP